MTDRYRFYALIALTVVYSVNLFDRGLMFVLLEPIKRDLNLSDFQAGLIVGFPFAICYAVFGIVFARWADRGTRVAIVSVAMVLWSLSGLANVFVASFAQLLFVRMLVGMGDAGCKPPIYSLIGDYFPDPKRRLRAMYIFEAAGPVGGFFSFVGAGWLNQEFGWRTTFLMMSVPGVLLAIWVRASLREPPRQAATCPADGPSTTLVEVLRLMWTKSSCRYLTIAMILIFLMGQGIGNWQSAFMIRQHGMSTAELGVFMGLIFPIGGAIGLVIGSRTLEMFVPDNERGQLAFAAAAIGTSIPVYATFLMAGNKYASLAALFPYALLFSAYVPVTFVVLQRVVPPNARATVLMIIMFFSTVIGAGLGPMLVGFVSDVLSPTLGNDGLRYSMLVMSLLSIPAAVSLWKAGQAAPADIVEVEGELAGAPEATTP